MSSEPEPLSSKAEERLQADSQPGVVRDLTNRQEHPRHEGNPVGGVVADREGLARATEEDLLVGDEAGESHAVDVHAVALGTPGTRQDLHGGGGRGDRLGVGVGPAGEDLGDRRQGRARR